MSDIIYDKKPAKEVAELISAMSPIFRGKNQDTVLKACLAVAILMHKPKMELTKLIEGVEGASEWISLFVMDTASKGVN